MKPTLTLLGSALISFLLACLVGCSMLPATKHDSAALKAADSISTQQTLSVEKMVDIPPPTISAYIPQPGASQAVVLGTNPVQVAQAALALPAQGPSTYIASGQGYHSTVRVTSSTGQQAGSTTAADSAISITLPLGVKLLLLAAGIAAMIAVVWWFKRANPAVGAAIEAGERAAAGAIKAADQVMANQIDRLRERAMKASSPVEVAMHTTDIASLEASRGKLAKGIT